MAVQAHSTKPYQTFADLTLDSAARTPEALALADDSLQLTFHELRCAAHALARQFEARGVAVGDHIALVGPHCVTQAVAILAAGLLGAAFVPLDPALPPARLRLLLANAHPRLVVASESLATKVGLTPASSCEPLLTREAFFDWRSAEQIVRAQSGVRRPPVLVQPSKLIRPDDVAYIIYTASATGHPKGVQIQHAALVTFFESYNVQVGIGAGDRCLNTGPFHSDSCLLDVFLPLHFGASVFLRSGLPLGTLVLHELSARRITHFFAAGSLLTQITGDGARLDRFDLHALKVLQTVSEACKPAIINEWLRRCPHMTFNHAYGPTEVTVGCMQYTKPATGLVTGEHIPLGTPHLGTSALLLDSHQHEIASAWLVGELLLGGAQLMQGYWKAPESTRRAFLQFEGQRYYRTGDLAYRDEHGVYWFAGRSDDQVKFLGHRIHLHELRDTVTSLPVVHSATAALLPDAHGQEHLALIVHVGCPLSTELTRRLREHAREQLPAHMQPSVIGLVVDWPRRASGKADTQACLDALAQAVAQFGRGVYRLLDDGFVPFGRAAFEGQIHGANRVQQALKLHTRLYT